MERRGESIGYKYTRFLMATIFAVTACSGMEGLKKVVANGSKETNGFVMPTPKPKEKKSETASAKQVMEAFNFTQQHGMCPKKLPQELEGKVPNPEIIGATCPVR